jgi:hypothetical protein
VEIDVLQENSEGAFGPWHQIAYIDGEMLDYESNFDGGFEPPVSGYFPAENVIVHPKHYIKTNCEPSPVQTWQRMHRWEWQWYGVWH